MKRLTCITILIAAAALVGCAEEEGPQAVPQSGPEDDARQTAEYARVRAEWEVLAERGDARSQRQLGVMYFLGQGLDKDYAKAFEWFDKAAGQGEDIAQLYLGVMYATGWGVPQSHVQAYMWYSLSAEQGNPSAGARLDELAQSMTEAEISEAQRLAGEWTPTY